MRPFSDVDGKMRCFIGDPTVYVRNEGKDWDGDEAVIESGYSSIKVQYDDEAPDPMSLKGFLSKLF